MMDVKKIVKDALILCLITLIAGMALGVTNEVTKPIIDEARIEKTNELRRTVFPGAAGFEEFADIEGILKLSELAVSYQNFGDVSVDDAVKAVDESGNVIGYVVTATSNEGYGGAVQIIAGIDPVNAKVLGLDFLTLNETAGLGMKAKEPAFLDQFPGKKAAVLHVVKTQTEEPEEVQAITGATKTSKAVTGALNAAVYFATHCVGGAEE